VSAKELFDRVLAAFVLAILCFLVLAAVQAEGTPIKPDVKKLAEQAQRPRPMFIPSRVGWNGSEMTDRAASLESTIAPVLAAERQRRMRNTLRQLLIPDPVAIVGIAAVIFLLRKLRHLREQQMVLARQPQTV
jgi:hypothetical protein